MNLSFTVSRRPLLSICFGWPLGRPSLVLIGIHLSELVEVIYAMHCFVLPFPLRLFPRSLPFLLLLLLFPFLLHFNFPSSLPLKSLQFFFLLCVFGVLLALFVCTTGPTCSMTGPVEELDPALALLALIGFVSAHIVMVFVISSGERFRTKFTSFWFHIAAFIVITIRILRS